MSLKAAQRGLVLGLAVVISFFRFGVLRLFAALKGRAVTPLERAHWMQRSNRLVLAAMGIQFRVEGPIPQQTTLLASNHLSYLDIVIASAAIPCAFVAKREIAGWPIFGPLGTYGGTIFLDRASRVSAWDTVDRMVERLSNAVLVLFFPEGTSTDGSEVTRFHSTLFAPAVELGIPVTPMALFYVPKSAGVPNSAGAGQGSDLKEKDLCWFGDDLFFPHLLRVLGVVGFTAVVRFGQPESFADRQAAAWRTHDAVAELRKNANPI